MESNVRGDDPIDGLAALFESVGDFKPEKDISMADEAVKPYPERVREIVETLNDEENELVIRGRALGEAIVDGGDIVEVELSSLLGGDEIATQMLNSEEAEERLQLLERSIESLRMVDGRRSLSKRLSGSQVTADEGRRRKEYQDNFVVLEAALYQAALSEFDKGSLGAGLRNFRRAMPTAIKSPSWVEESLAKVVDGLTISDAGVEEVLVNEVYRNRREYGLEQSDSALIEGGEELSSAGAVGRLYSKAFEAKKAFDVKVAKEAEKEKQEKYERDMVENKKLIFNGAVDSAKERVGRYKGNKAFDAVGYGKVFSDYALGERMLSGWMKAKVDRNVLFGESWREAKGIVGFSDVLGRLQFNEEIKGMLVSYASDVRFTDFGGRSKEVYYEEEKRMDEWNGLLEDELEIEVKGQAMGVLINLMEKEVRWDERDDSAVKNILKILGEGEMFNKLFRGQGSISEIDELLRKKLRELLEKGNETVRNRVQTLGRLAQEVDVQMLREIRQREEEDKQRDIEKNEERERLVGMIEDGREMAGGVELLVTELGGVMELDKMVGAWRNLNEVVEIGGVQKGDKDPIILNFREKQLEKVESQIAELNEKLSRSDGVKDEMELRFKLRGLQLRRVFLGEVKSLLGGLRDVDKVTVKRRKTGLAAVFGYKDIQMIGNNFFTRITEPDNNLLAADLGREAEILARKADTLGQVGVKEWKVAAIADLKDKLNRLSESDGDVLAGTQEVEKVVGGVRDKRDMLVLDAKRMKGKLESKARSMARDLIKERLARHLQSRNRYSWS